jgi:N-acetylglucosamine kinase-like BadF-type ATPase
MSVPRDIISLVYGPEGTKARIASLARVVIEHAEAGDAVASRILDEQAQLLVSLVGPVHQRLFAGESAPAPLGLWGGNLVHVKSYRDRFLARLEKTGLNVEPVLRPDAEAVDGAARHALNVLAGSDVSGI